MAISVLIRPALTLIKGDCGMLGIQDKWVLLAYVLCIVSTLLCVLYGYFNWNKGDTEVKPEDKRWAKEEDKADEKM